MSIILKNVVYLLYVYGAFLGYDDNIYLPAPAPAPNGNVYHVKNVYFLFVRVFRSPSVHPSFNIHKVI